MIFIDFFRTAKVKNYSSMGKEIGREIQIKNCIDKRYGLVYF